MIEIESGIPIPKRDRVHRARLVGYGELKATLCRMSIGDSFVYPESRKQSVYAQAAGLGIHLTARKTGSGLVRFWKTLSKNLCVDSPTEVRQY